MSEYTQRENKRKRTRRVCNDEFHAESVTSFRSQKHYILRVALVNCVQER